MEEMDEPLTPTKSKKEVKLEKRSEKADQKEVDGDKKGQSGPFSIVVPDDSVSEREKNAEQKEQNLSLIHI